MAWLDLAQDLKLSDDFFDKVKIGQVLGFKQPDGVVHYKIMRLNKTKGRVWAKPYKLWTPEELEAMERMRNGES